MKEISENPVNALLLSAIGDAFDCPPARRLSDKDVHAARKKVTKGRAALRLLRPAMAEVDYRKGNALLRDVGHRLATLRDARSMLDILAAIATRYASELEVVDLAPLRRSLLSRRAQARRELSGAARGKRACTEFLEQFGELARRSGLTQADSTTLNDGLRLIYRKGRKAFACARRERTPEALHAWRKQVKYLLNATAILQHRAGARRVRKIARRADRIASLLGDDHDLAMLHDAIDPGTIDARAFEILHGLISRRRLKLQSRAFDRGRKLFAKKPRRFVMRLEGKE